VLPTVVIRRSEALGYREHDDAVSTACQGVPRIGYPEPIPALRMRDHISADIWT
jgi:hypothetical protein